MKKILVINAINIALLAALMLVLRFVQITDVNTLYLLKSVILMSFCFFFLNILYFAVDWLEKKAKDLTDK